MCRSERSTGSPAEGSRPGPLTLLRCTISAQGVEFLDHLFSEDALMRRFTLVLLLIFILAGVSNAGRYFAAITSVDPAKGTIVYNITFGKERNMEVKATVAKDCVIKEGYYRLGKPATTKEGDDIVNGLKNPVLSKATPQNPVRVNIYTADADDACKGIRKGDVVKILVNPPPRKK